MTADTIITPLTKLAIPDGAEMSESAQRTLAFATAYIITNDEELVLAGEELRDVKTKLSELEERRTKITGPMNDALRSINDLFRVPRGALENAEDALKKAISTYTIEKARKAEEERMLAEEATRRERERLQAEAEIAARAAEAARAAGNTQHAEEVQARADALQTTAAVIVAPVNQAPRTKLAGISSRKGIEFTVTDLLAFVRHVAEHPELVDLLMVDSVRMRAYTKGLGLNSNLPGIKVEETTTIAAKTR